jgi:hypothetical protein
VGAAVLSQWAEFLQLTWPGVPGSAPDRRSRPALNRFGEGAELEPDNFVDAPRYEAALKQYEAEPEVQVLFEAGGVTGGSPVPSFTASFASWPPRTTATTWWFGPDGTLTRTQPTGTGSDQFSDDPAALPATSAAVTAGDSLSGINPAYSWQTLPDGKAIGYVTAPLTKEAVLAGTGSVDVFSPRCPTSCESISEVRPDGQETYVQSGWLRASKRKVDTATSRALLPVQTYREADVRQLRSGKATLLRVPLYPFAHVFRARSRIRIACSRRAAGPAGVRRAAVHTSPHGATVTVDRSAALEGHSPWCAASASPPAACGTLRGQPCRRQSRPPAAPRRAHRLTGDTRRRDATHQEAGALWAGVRRLRARRPLRGALRRPRPDRRER